jgi:proteasome accessory factor B
VRTRHLQPWGVARYSGRWYVVGFDTDRQAERIFRLSRVEGKATTSGPPGSYEIPPGTDVSQVARRLAPTPSTERVVLLVRKGAGHTLRRGADAVEEGVPGPDTESTWDRVVLERATVGVADEVLGYGADVYVEEPERLRERVVRRLRATLGQDALATGEPT